MSLNYRLSRYSSPITKDNEIIGFCAGWRKIYFKDSLAEINRLAQSLNNSKQTPALPPHNDNYSEILIQLYELGFLEQATAKPMPWSSYQEHVLATTRTKRYRMLQERGLSNNSTLTAKILLKSLLESYYLIDAAADHILAAFDDGLSDKELAALDEYLDEECWHGRLLYHGLRKGGLSDADIRNNPPLQETTQLINFLTRLAKEDFTAYSLCISITESPTDCPGYIKNRLREWRKIEDLNLISRDILDVFRKHEECDFTADHGSFSQHFRFKGNVIQPLRQCELESLLDQFIDLQGQVYQAVMRSAGNKE